MLKTVTINGTTFSVSALTITKEPIWSKNAGRVADGSMQGDIIAYKYKLEVSFPPFSDAKATALGHALNATFFTVKFHDPTLNADVSKTMYAGTPSYPVYSYVDDLPRYTNVAINLIER